MCRFSVNLQSQNSVKNVTPKHQRESGFRGVEANRSEAVRPHSALRGLTECPILKGQRFE